MTKISERWRKILRNVFRGIGVSVVSLVIQACYGILPPDVIECEYGMPPPDYVEETTIRGKVTAKKTGKPIPGINVSVEIEGTDYWERTDKDGYFYLRVPTQNVYELKLKDVDGEFNDGLFQEQTWPVKLEDTYSTLIMIGMDIEE
jgi:putative lipoprotein (rSAM/lipoprotein system)